MGERKGEQGALPCPRPAGHSSLLLHLHLLPWRSPNELSPKRLADSFPPDYEREDFLCGLTEVFYKAQGLKIKGNVSDYGISGQRT